jgi:hypothetical protein
MTIGTFCVNLEDFFPVLVSGTKKNLATLRENSFFPFGFNLFFSPRSNYTA